MTQTETEEIVRRLRGHHSMTPPPYSAMEDAAGLIEQQAREIAALKAQVGAEREACAKIAEDYDGEGLDGKFMREGGSGSLTASDIAAAIRARGEAPPPASTPEKGWQPVDENTHKDVCAWGSTVLIAGKYPNGVPYVEESYWDTRGWWANRKLEPPTHWMPLPPPPGASPTPVGYRLTDEFRIEDVSRALDREVTAEEVEALRRRGKEGE